ncbi:MAG: hypothetical protein D6757_10850 [Alphaproteobacteria bacterium]|nr:MAG: hypothetical protein D6757_10850 [Alphaproteobacteria bacterium]
MPPCRSTRLRTVFRFGLLLALVLVALQGALAGPDPRRIRAKAARAVAHLEEWVREGRDVSMIVPRMRQVKVLADHGRLAEADALLNDILARFEAGERGTAGRQAAGDAGQNRIDEFVNDRLVRIMGYDGDAMEPFVSADGRYLFFNNAGGKTGKDIFHAERIDDTHFRFLGPLSGVNSPAVDGVPTMDRTGRFYFVSTRNYRPGSLATIYAGKFHDGEVGDIHPLPELAEGRFGWLNMDIEVSRDGRTIYATQTWFGDGPPPTKSRFFLARRVGDHFVPQPDSAAIFASINADEVVYGATLSADEREILYTRLRRENGALHLDTMRAERPSRDVPFGRPRIVSAITGFAEAPALGPDGRRLYYHKRNGLTGRFEIHVLERRRSPPHRR